MSGDSLSDRSVDYIPLVPAPEVDALGFCTMCGEKEDMHTDVDGGISVRGFHRRALGGQAKFIDEA